MAKNFKYSAFTHKKNTKILIEFRTAAKYDSDFYRIEQYLWEECWRRRDGKPVIPDKEYNKWRWGLWVDHARIIGDYDEFKPKRKEESEDLQATEGRLQEAVSIPATETS